MNKQELMALGLSEEAADQVLKAHVPYDRFRQVNEDKKALEGQLKERDEVISGLNTKLKAGEDAAASITQLQAQLKEKDAAFLSQRKEVTGCRKGEVGLTSPLCFCLGCEHGSKASQAPSPWGAGGLDVPVILM